MKRTALLSILFFFIIIILAAGCGEKNKPEDKTVKFWHFWSEPYQKRALDSLIARFERETGIEVETTELSWNDGKTKLLAAFNSGTAPDVLELGSDWVAQFSSAGVLAALDQDSAEIGKYLEFARAPGYWDGSLYAIPWVVDTRVLFYNKALMRKAGLGEELPATLDKLLNYSRKINVIDGVYGFGANGSDPHRLYKKIVPLMWTYGGRVLVNGVPVLHSLENIEALTLYTDLARAGVVETQRQIDASFVRGEIGYWISGGWLLEKIVNENPSLEYGVAMLPGHGDAPGISFAGGEYISINKNSQKFDAAFRFAKYLTDGRNAIEFCKQVTEAGFPADSNYYNDPFYQSRPDRLVFARQLASARMTPVHPRWLDIEASLEEATVEALYGRKTPAEALEDAQQEALRIMKKK